MSIPCCFSQTSVHGGQPWFIGTYVLKTIYGRTTGRGNIYVRLGADELTNVRRFHLESMYGKDMVLGSEADLYKLVMRSDKPALPGLGHTGSPPGHPQGRRICPGRRKGSDQ